MASGVLNSLSLVFLVSGITLWLTSLSSVSYTHLTLPTSDLV